MEQTKQQRVAELTDQLNRYRHEYYNLNAPSVTDEVYDSLFDELARLEQETGICMANSPTQTVGCSSRQRAEENPASNSPAFLG